MNLVLMEYITDLVERRIPSGLFVGECTDPDCIICTSKSPYPEDMRLEQATAEEIEA